MKRALTLLVLAALGLGVRLEIRPPMPEPIRRPPAPADASNAVDRGRAVYRRYGCAMCHGADGKGGFANANAETGGKVPGLLYVKEGYTARELRKKLLDGAPTIGKADSRGPVPPYRMPGWRGRMNDAEVNDLVEYLFGLYPKSAEEKWR